MINSPNVKVRSLAGRAEIIDPTLDSRWDSWVQMHPEGRFFHGSAWAAVLKQTYGHVPTYLVAGSGEQDGALWPVMEVRSRWFGTRGVSLPFTDFCEPLVGAGGAAGDMLAAALDVGRVRRWRYFEFRGGQRHFQDLPASCPYYVHRLSLRQDTDAIFRNCRGSVRQAVRKARRSGIRVEISRSEDAVRNYYRLHCRTRRRQGLPPQPYAFFRNIQSCLLARDQGIVVTARHNDRPVASAIFFRQGDRVIYKFGASNEAFQHLRGNNLVMWAGIEHFSHLGCRTLCFGRTSLTNEGLRQFKLGWGAEEQKQVYFRYDFRLGSFGRDPDRATGWYNGIFRLLPLLASRWIGAVLYRHWA